MTHYIAHFIKGQDQEYIVILDEYQFAEAKEDAADASIGVTREYGLTDWELHNIIEVDDADSFDMLPTGYVLMKRTL